MNESKNMSLRDHHLSRLLGNSLSVGYEERGWERLLSEQSLIEYFYFRQSGECKERVFDVPKELTN